MIDDDPPQDDDEPEIAPADQPTVDSGTRRGHESQKRRIKREQKEADELWRRLLNDTVGRRELWRLACGPTGAHAFETRFQGTGELGLPNEYATWYAKGEQDFGLRLYHRWLLLDPIAVGAMHAENDPRFARKKGE